LSLDARDGRHGISYVAFPAGLRPETHSRRDSNATDRTSLPPEAAESHTHLAHAVIRYLGLTAPEELVPFGINSAAGIVDLISRVRILQRSSLLNPLDPSELKRFQFFLRTVVCNELYNAHLSVAGTTRRLRFSADCAGQSFMQPERCRRIPAFCEKSRKPRAGSATHRNT
jgi:hypothetical protein